MMFTKKKFKQVIKPGKQEIKPQSQRLDFKKEFDGYTPLNYSRDLFAELEPYLNFDELACLTKVSKTTYKLVTESKQPHRLVTNNEIIGTYTQLRELISIDQPLKEIDKFKKALAARPHKTPVKTIWSNPRLNLSVPGMITILASLTYLALEAFFIYKAASLRDIHHETNAIKCAEADDDSSASALQEYEKKGCDILGDWAVTAIIFGVMGPLSIFFFGIILWTIDLHEKKIRIPEKKITIGGDDIEISKAEWKDLVKKTEEMFSRLEKSVLFTEQEKESLQSTKEKLNQTKLPITELEETWKKIDLMANHKASIFFKKNNFSKPAPNTTDAVIDIPWIDINP